MNTLNDSQTILLLSSIFLACDEDPTKGAVHFWDETRTQALVIALEGGRSWFIDNEGRPLHNEPIDLDAWYDDSENEHMVLNAALVEAYKTILGKEDYTSLREYDCSGLDPYDWTSQLEEAQDEHYDYTEYTHGYVAARKVFEKMTMDEEVEAWDYLCDVGFSFEECRSMSGFIETFVQVYEEQKTREKIEELGERLEDAQGALQAAKDTYDAIMEYIGEAVSR